MYQSEIEDNLSTVEQVQSVLAKVRGDKSLSSQERKNIIKRLTRRLEKLQAGEVVKKARRNGTKDTRSPEERMGEVLVQLREHLPEVQEDILLSHAGTGYPQANILEAMDALKTDAAGIAGTLVEAYRKRWAEPPRWFTTYKYGAGVVLVLGPVPATTGF